MKKLVVFGLALLATLAMGERAAQANSPGFKGTWELTASLEPGRSFGGILCMNFVRTNSVLGVTKYSGTWSHASDPTSGGEWIQLGDFVYWWGQISESSSVQSFSGNMETVKQMGGVTVVEFDAATGAAGAAGSFTMKKKNCAPKGPESQSGTSLAPAE
jgi:hypothetical protein